MKYRSNFIAIICLSIFAFVAFNTIDTPNTNKEIQNNHEWDQVEEIVVGRWVRDAFEIPMISENVKNLYPYISDSSFNYMGRAQGHILADIYPQDDQEFYTEQENLVKVVESLGVKVRRPEELEVHSIATSQPYSRDPIITIGNKVIIANMNLEARRLETANYRRIALDLAKNYNGEVVNMPANKAGLHEDNIYLEGGDVFVNGKEIYVGLSGNASNEAGVEWLQKELGDNYKVYGIQLQHHVLHLDCAMMLLNDHQGVVCKGDFVDFDALPASLKKYEWVEVKPEQAQLMATNGMVINDHTVIVSNAFPEVNNRIKALGIDVIEIPFRKANYFGGGIRCSYQPIYRQ
ncbi:dimethylarginine dimethylaminohydrolase family protein [Flammeovirga sp. OC4]|uniref:dimethylarginine dimethylaminohydrolase family protein n=1 Tax=Flammeovirga sp. OC4 TaxID=1382345 RepID=UPI0005C76A26|nr:arginine deiminase family protein [Flammeovirga sp. OC4]